MARKSSQFWALLLFSIGIFMAQLDNGIISSALTTINRHFDVTDNWGAWGITIYTLGLAISLPIVGKLSDRYGRKKLFLIEIALFGLGSLLVALSPSFGIYLTARFIQALGGGIGTEYRIVLAGPDRKLAYSVPDQCADCDCAGDLWIHATGGVVGPKSGTAGFDGDGSIIICGIGDYVRPDQYRRRLLGKLQSA